MSQNPHHEPPISDLSTWSVERLEALVTARHGQELEQVRVVAQSQAYRPDGSRHVRLRWAKLSLNANEQAHGHGPWEQSRVRSQNFALRTWIIERLGPDTDPDWNPEILGADTLAALTLDPDHACSLSEGWPELPAEQIAELRRHKILTAHLDQLTDMLQPGPAKDQLTRWREVRHHLP